jgi:hypothetical protein
MAQGIPGLQIPAEMDAQHRQKLEKLQSADGRQFYQLYRAQQIEAHQNAVKLFTDYAKSDDASRLTSWAQKTLPVLQQHLQHAQALPQNPAQVGQAPGGGAAHDQHAQRPSRQVGQKAAQPLASASPNHIMVQIFVAPPFTVPTTRASARSTTLLSSATETSLQ